MTKNKLLSRLRPNIKKLTPYQSARLTSPLKTKTQILLNANENPYQINKTESNRYPEPQPKKLRSILANLYNVKENQILITRGSDEAIDILIKSFCEPKKDKILICNPTFAMYQIYAEIQDIEIKNIPLKKENNQLNLDSIKKYKNDNTIKLLFIPNPSAPLGNLLHEKDILELCNIFKNKALVVIDEAYIEFTNKDSFTEKINDISNVAILRTLSKAYSMAGLRIGACISNKEIISAIKPVLAPYPLSINCIVEAEKNLQENSLITLKNNMQKIIKNRELLKKELGKLKFIKKIHNSETNFLFIECSNHDEIMKICKENNILLRPFNKTVKGGIRISIGTKKENSILIDCLKSIQ